MKVETAYWWKRGLRITLEGSQAELKKILEKTTNHSEIREYKEYDILDLTTKIHLCLKIPKHAGRKAGDIVTIYEDPLTEQKPEGKAKLVQKVNEDELGLERWLVEFVEDGSQLYRWIKKEETTS